MNSTEAKKGFLTFIILTFVISIMSYIVNIVVTTPTSSSTNAGSGALQIPETQTFILVGTPILLLGIVVTIFKQINKRGL